jgi:hypothetical protein
MRAPSFLRRVGQPERPSAGGSPSPPADPPRSRRRELALTLVTLALIVGASADFLLAQTLKLEPSPLDRPRVEAVFSPMCGCETKATATLAFSVREPFRVDAQMIDADDRAVRSLARAQAWGVGRRTLQWDGRDDAGRLVPDGPYRLRVRLLEGERREIVVPTPVTVDSVPPTAELLAIEPRTLVPSPRGRPDRPAVKVRYRADEPARPTLLVDGHSATRRGPRPSGRSTIEWGGRARGDVLPPGTYAVAVQLRDRAGNRGRPSRALQVRVRRPTAERGSGRGRARRDARR